MSVTVKDSGAAMILAWYEPTGGTAIGADITKSIVVNRCTLAMKEAAACTQAAMIKKAAKTANTEAASKTVPVTVKVTGTAAK